MAKKVTLENFIQRSKIFHGDRYDYSKVDFINTKTKVCIVCPKHGEFWQIPETHMKGTGCPKCAHEKINKINKGKRRKILTPEEKIQEFKLKAKQIHNDKYDYSKVTFNNYTDKIEIICPKHGSFWQSAHHHLQGQKCPACADENRSNSYKLTKEEFIRRARQIHGDKYDYSKVENPKYNEKVTIICPIHGEFQQFVNNHLFDSGCPKCSKHFNYDTETFIMKANQVHNHKYLYNKTNYINARTKVTITCPIHGDFEQLPSTHLSGGGCPKCTQTKGEIIVSQVLDKLKYPYTQQKKICLNLNNKTIIVDFYIKRNGIEYIIEYNGKQHYEPVDYFGGEEQFKKQQLRDCLLREYCKLYNIKLLEIPYTDKDIENTILNFLNNL